MDKEDTVQSNTFETNQFFNLGSFLPAGGQPVHRTAPSTNTPAVRISDHMAAFTQLFPGRTFSAKELTHEEETRSCQKSKWVHAETFEINKKPRVNPPTDSANDPSSCPPSDNSSLDEFWKSVSDQRLPGLTSTDAVAFNPTAEKPDSLPSSDPRQSPTQKPVEDEWIFDENSNSYKKKEDDIWIGMSTVLPNLHQQPKRSLRDSLCEEQWDNKKAESLILSQEAVENDVWEYDSKADSYKRKAVQSSPSKKARLSENTKETAIEIRKRRDHAMVEKLIKILNKKVAKKKYIIIDEVYRRTANHLNKTFNVISKDAVRMRYRDIISQNPQYQTQCTEIKNLFHKMATFDLVSANTIEDNESAIRKRRDLAMLEQMIKILNEQVAKKEYIEVNEVYSRTADYLNKTFKVISKAAASERYRKIIAKKSEYQTQCAEIKELFKKLAAFKKIKTGKK